MINLDTNTFMGAYQAKESLCDEIIKFFNQHKKYATPGVSYNNMTKKSDVDKSAKESIDLGVSSQHLYYPMDEYRNHLQESLDKYVVTYPDANAYSRYVIQEDYNIQYYPPGGGFKQWHFEAASLKDMRRVFVFMTYLNDVPDGGTIFRNQNLTVPAKKGLTVIWPAGFTHVHKGQISLTKEKYIVTGWWSLI